MIKRFLGGSALAAILTLTGCAMDMSMPSTEIARATVNDEVFILYDTHHGIVPGTDIYDMRWASNDRHFGTYTASSDEEAIRRFESQIARTLEKWANCRGAGQICRDNDEDDD